MPSRRLVGIDVGSKRIGVSRSDPSAIIATPIGTFSNQKIISCLKDLNEEDPIGTFIVGWPLSINGHLNTSTEMVEKFIKRLTKNFPQAEVVKVDERYSSEYAKQALIDSGVKKKKRSQKGLVDSTVATILLQEYLDESYR